MKKILIILLALMPMLAMAQRQTIKTISNATPASTKRYWEYLPPGYETSTGKKYTVVIFLHGLGQKGDTEAEMSSIIDLPGTPPYDAKTVDLPFILLSPQLPKSQGGWYRTYVGAMINRAKNYYNSDPENIYVVGLSLGGGGTLLHAADPEWDQDVQGIVSVCASSSDLNDACNVANNNMRVWAFHGTADNTTNVSVTTSMINAINACSPTVAPKLTLYQGADHNIWGRAFNKTNEEELPNVYQWIMQSNPRTPVANAGEDLTVSLPNPVSITGSGTDSDGTIQSYKWIQFSGPNIATLSGASTATLQVSNMVAGDYKFHLQVTDDLNWPSTPDEITVHVLPNQAPSANAGADQSITYPANSVTLTGTGSDAEGPVTFAWTKLEGPPSGTIVSPTSATTVVDNLEAGTYTFRLTVTDNASESRTDDVVVVVNPAQQSGAKTWNSWDIITQSNPLQQGVVNSTSGNVTADVEFYISDNIFGVDKVSLLPVWNGTVHNDLNARVTNYWALTEATSTSRVYPYAGKSTVARGLNAESGETNVPSPTGVYDLQLHPPNTDNQMVSAFIAPFAGNYTISNLSVRKLSTGGTTVKYKVYDKNKTLLTTLVTIDDSRAWVTSPASFPIGTLAAGDRIYFATERDGLWDYDMTEVAWSVSGVPAPQSWFSYNINTQSDPAKQGVVTSTLGTEATIEFYISDDVFGVNKVALLPEWNGTVHNDLNARVTNYWALTQATSTSRVYPYAGKSTVGRGTNNESGETNVPTPTDVFDLQLHPPYNDKQMVAAFIVPVEGTYTINNLSVRKLSTGGTTVKFKAYNQNKTLLTTLVTIDDSRAWVNSSESFFLGTLAAGDRIYFATERDGLWDYDMTEVAFGITLNGGSPMARLAAQTQEVAVEDVLKQEEQYEDYKVVVFNNQGQRVEEFIQACRPSDLDALNLRSLVDQKGLYIFRIIGSQNDVKVKRIMFLE